MTPYEAGRFDAISSLISAYADEFREDVGVPCGRSWIMKGYKCSPEKARELIEARRKKTGSDAAWAKDVDRRAKAKVKDVHETKRQVRAAGELRATQNLSAEDRRNFQKRNAHQVRPLRKENEMMGAQLKMGYDKDGTPIAPDMERSMRSRMEHNGETLERLGVSEYVRERMTPLHVGTHAPAKNGGIEPLTGRAGQYRQKVFEEVDREVHGEWIKRVAAGEVVGGSVQEQISGQKPLSIKQQEQVRDVALMGLRDKPANFWKESATLRSDPGAMADTLLDVALRKVQTGEDFTIRRPSGPRKAPAERYGPDRFGVKQKSSESGKIAQTAYASALEGQNNRQQGATKRKVIQNLMALGVDMTRGIEHGGDPEKMIPLAIARHGEKRVEAAMSRALGKDIKLSKAA